MARSPEVRLPPRLPSHRPHQPRRPSRRQAPRRSRELLADLVEVAARLVVVETRSTGIALLFSKLVPYACALGLSIWTLTYGEREKRQAERLAGSA